MVLLRRRLRRGDWKSDCVKLYLKTSVIERLTKGLRSVGHLSTLETEAMALVLPLVLPC